MRFKYLNVVYGSMIQQRVTSLPTIDRFNETIFKCPMRPFFASSGKSAVGGEFNRALRLVHTNPQSKLFSGFLLFFSFSFNLVDN